MVKSRIRLDSSLRKSPYCPLLGEQSHSPVNANGGDTIKGFFGDDVLTGSTAGNDILNGGTGDDRIKGNQGNDILRGEAGADIFVFQTGANVDRIRDWQDGSDHINLTSYNFTDVASALTQFAQQGAHVRFIDGSDTLVIENTLLADITAANLIL